MSYEAALKRVKKLLAARAAIDEALVDAQAELDEAASAEAVPTVPGSESPITACETPRAKGSGFHRKVAR